MYYSNRSLVYFRKKDGETALADAEKCISIKPTWVRGYSRKSNALQLLGRHEELMETCQKGLAIDSSNTVLQ